MPLITDLSVSGFRGLRSLKLDGLGRVNLITGRNNSGKSSLLEALRVFAANGSPRILANILRLREEDLTVYQRLRDDNATGFQESPQVIDIESEFPWSNLFYGFPKFSTGIEPIEITASLENWPAVTRLECMLVDPGKEKVEGTQLRDSELVYGSPDGEPGLVITGDDQRYSITLDRMVRNMGRLVGGVSQALDQRMVCNLVSPYGAERTDSLAKLWDAAILSAQEQTVVEALAIIDSRIRTVSMIAGETQRTRYAVVKAEGLPRPVPLRTFGDGLNRIFGIVLSLVNVPDGLLLIDEFENGLHYSVLTDVWRVIFETAQKTGVQVFATSHSWDAIEAFQKVANDHTEQGTLVRLVRRGDDVIPTIFSEDELEVITRANIEVR